MYITLIKDAESIQSNPKKPRKITYGGVASRLSDSTKLLHFCGKRPLCIANSSGVEINLPQNPLPLPDLIITAQKKISYETGKIVNETAKDVAGEAITIRAGIASLNPNKVMSNLPSLQHLVVVGPESTLQKWTKYLCKDKNSRTKNSSMCIIKDGKPVYDANQDQEMYLIGGLVDHILCNKINNQEFNSPEEAKMLLPFYKKVYLVMEPQQMLHRIKQKD